MLNIGFVEQIKQLVEFGNENWYILAQYISKRFNTEHHIRKRLQYLNSKEYGGS